MGYTTARLLVAAFSLLQLGCGGIESTTLPVGPTLAMPSAEVTDGFVFQFHDCVGPVGTPSAFTAVKTELPTPALPAFAQATAYRLTDGSAIFLALIRGDRHHPPGIDPSGVATTSCLVDTPIGTLWFSGFLAPAI